MPPWKLVSCTFKKSRKTSNTYFALNLSTYNVLIFSLLPSFSFDPSVSRVLLPLPTIVYLQQQNISICSENADGVEDM